MGRAAVRVLQVLLATLGGLVILPFAVNLETGGTAPQWLQPFRPVMWPTALGCLLLLIGLEIWDRVGAGDPARPARRTDDERNVRRALEQVSRYVAARRLGLLDERIRLTLDERPDAVRQPLHLVQRVSGNAFELSEDVALADVFDEMDESMLILGAPGAGKTTQLLDLAGELVARAQPAGNVPVVLDLGGWARPRRSWFRPRGVERAPRPLAEWIVTELQSRYRIPAPIGRAWLHDGRLVLLLDGLDEVEESFRERCLDEINALQERIRTARLVVCSREADYDRLTGSLRAQGAVVIRPLTKEQILDYLGDVAPVLTDDAELWEVLTTPLMLNVVVLARGNEDWDEVARASGPAELRRLLFDAYVVEVLARNRGGSGPAPAETLRAIQILACASAASGSGTGLTALDGDALTSRVSRAAAEVTTFWLMPICQVLGAVSVTAVAAAWAGRVFGAGVAALCVSFVASAWSQAPVRPSIARRTTLLAFVAIVAVVNVAVLALLFWSARNIPLPSRTAAGVTVAVATLPTVWLLLRAVTRKVVTWRFFWQAQAVAAGTVVFVVVVGVRREAVVGFVLGVFVLLVVMTFDPREGQRKALAVEGRPSLPRKALAVLALFGTAVLVGRGAEAVPLDAISGVVLAFLLGMFPIAFVGITAEQVLNRVALSVAGEPDPWRRSFLRSTADRGLLVRIAREYRFAHLLIRDHLAGCDPAALGAAVQRRRAELVAA
ncbi:NACHT domain-containing protein [Paractinoplanes brasiliensis]|uniref:NACHT domain-containing protein n=1 Tax=Paractinoplanes brasiliensis TaxID=52695 RepID=A0A4R6JQU8_9ACTN|nr:NACHT domain-containing protein [Actinoplanes brasiliensis]TDO38082.1 NACHT domain-containing protein [Actinoplanes brasiliensis]GID31173.1 hypothetical protein Abr02nite_61560 [Actinoplanes brasiliensis]